MPFSSKRLTLHSILGTHKVLALISIIEQILKVPGEFEIIDEE